MAVEWKLLVGGLVVFIEYFEVKITKNGNLHFINLHHVKSLPGWQIPSKPCHHLASSSLSPTYKPPHPLLQILLEKIPTISLDTSITPGGSGPVKHISKHFDLLNLILSRKIKRHTRRQEVCRQLLSRLKLWISGNCRRRVFSPPRLCLNWLPTRRYPGHGPRRQIPGTWKLTPRPLKMEISLVRGPMFAHTR